MSAKGEGGGPGAKALTDSNPSGKACKGSTSGAPSSVMNDELSLCGNEHGCKCGMIYSTVGNGPFATLGIGDWGDDYPSLRFVREDAGSTACEGGIAVKVEAYMEQMTYGHIPPKLAYDRGRRTVTVWNALRGVPDPAAFVRAADALAEWCELRKTQTENAETDGRIVLAAYWATRGGPKAAGEERSL